MSLKTQATAAMLIVLVAGGLAGCGKVGQLERPGPLFANERNTTADADKAQKAQDPSKPVDTVDPRDRSTDPAPPRTLPIQGAGNDPFRAPPTTALGNVYDRPAR